MLEVPICMNLVLQVKDEKSGSSSLALPVIARQAKQSRLKTEIFVLAIHRIFDQVGKELLPDHLPAAHSERPPPLNNHPSLGRTRIQREELL